MSLVSGLLGFSAVGRAGNAINDANIAAEHGVLNATDSAQKGVQQQLGSNAINVGAAGDTAKNMVADATTNANNALSNTLSASKANFDPYLAAGQAGAAGLADRATNLPQFDFGKANFQDPNDPAYQAQQFQLKQGSEAINNSASATGLANSGNVLKALTGYGQSLANTYYDQAFQRAKSTFDTNQNASLANLTAAAGTGLNAAGQYNNALLNVGGQQAANTIGAGVYGGNTINNNALFNAQQGLQGEEYIGNAGIGGSKLAGDYAVNGAQGRAAGILGQGNSLSNIIGGIDFGKLFGSTVGDWAGAL